MPDTADHRAEMYHLAQERRAEGLPAWDRKIRLGGVFHNEALSFEQRRDAIVARLRASGWLKGRDKSDYLVQFVEELAGTEDAGEFDAVWDVIYDEADYDRVWIETVSVTR